MGLSTEGLLQERDRLDLGERGGDFAEDFLVLISIDADALQEPGLGGFGEAAPALGSHVGGDIGKRDDSRPAAADAGVVMVEFYGINDIPGQIPFFEQGAADFGVICPQKILFGDDPSLAALLDGAGDGSLGFGIEELVQDELADIVEQAGGVSDGFVGWAFDAGEKFGCFGGEERMTPEFAFIHGIACGAAVDDTAEADGNREAMDLLVTEIKESFFERFDRGGRSEESGVGEAEQPGAQDGVGADHLDDRFIVHLVSIQQVEQFDDRRSKRGEVFNLGEERLDIHACLP